MTFRALIRASASLVLVGTSACFATRSDMRVLQGDILTLRTEAARADSARAQHLAQLARIMTTLSDSLRTTGNRLTSFQGETRGAFRAVDSQLLQLQQLVGQSQTVIQRLREENERRLQQQLQAQSDAAAQPASPPTTPPMNPTQQLPPRPATDTALTVRPQVDPGPNQLYQDGLAQSARGSYGAAQAAFEEMLRLYPTSDLAPDALYFLAVAYDSDGKQAQADSTYSQVVARHPRSLRASTALYKMALSLARRGRRTDARGLMERVVREYPQSDEKELADEWLRLNR